MRLVAWLIGGSLAVLALSCESKQQRQIEVSVKDHTGAAISGAEVHLSGTLIGISDESGHLKRGLVIQPGVRRRLEVFYEHAEHHYAPYLKTFTVPHDAANKQSMPSPLSFEAVLYAMPKAVTPATDPLPLAEKMPRPSDEAEEPSATDKTLATEEPSAQAEEALALEGGEHSSPSFAAGAQSSDDEGKTNSLAQENVDAGSAQDYPPDQSSPLNGLPPEEHVAITPRAKPLSASSLELAQAGAEEAAAHHEGSAKNSSRSEEQDETSPKNTPLLDASPTSHASPPALQQLARKSWVVETSSSGAQPRPLGGVEVLVADDHTVHRWCLTSPQGYCARQVAAGVRGKVLFIARKAGYRTATRQAFWTARGRLSLSLERGQSLDVFAFKPGFFTLKGWGGVAVVAAGKKLGMSSAAGFFSVDYSELKGKQQTTEPVSIQLTHPDALPQQRTMQAISPHHPVVTLFEPRQAPKLNVLLMRPQYQPRHAGETPPQALFAQLAHLTTHHLYRHPMIHRVGWHFAASTSATASLTQLKERGWRSQALGLWADAMVSWHLYPATQEQEPSYLEAQLTLAQGEVHGAVAVQVDLSKKAQDPYWNQITAQQLNRLRSHFPYHGTLMSLKPLAHKQGTASEEESQLHVVVNLGKQHNLTAGNLLEIRPLRAAWNKSRFVTETSGVRSHIRIEQVNSQSSQGSLLRRGSTILPVPGDKVIFWGRETQLHSPKPSPTRLRCVADKLQHPLSGVTVFTLEKTPQWLGVSGVDGWLRWKTATLPETTKVAVRKIGYEVLHFSWADLKRISTPLRMKRLYVPLHIASEPAGRPVTLQGQAVGITPLSYFLAAGSNISLKVQGPEGFADIHRSFQAATVQKKPDMDFTGPRTLKLPQRHQDQLRSRLERIQQQLDTPTAQKDTAQPSVRRSDDLFQAGWVSFQLAESSGRHKDTARSISYYEQARTYLRQAAEHTQQSSQRVRALYYEALSSHRLALLRRDASLLQQSTVLWQEYLSKVRRISWPTDLPRQRYLQKAEGYAREARADLKNLELSHL